MPIVEINVHEAKTHLSRILARVAAGEEIVIARAGHPIARLVPYESPSGTRKLGGYRDRIRIADDFDDELPPEVLDGFER